MDLKGKFTKQNYKNCTKKKKKNYVILPMMRLFGSKTSIFSNKSTAPGDILGNLVANCCLGYCGSCLTYLRALSLRRNPRLWSSGEPMSFLKARKFVKIKSFFKHGDLL